MVPGGIAPGPYGEFAAMAPGVIAAGAIAPVADAAGRREIARHRSTATTAKPTPHSHEGTPDAAAGAVAVERAGVVNGGNAFSAGAAERELRAVGPACARSSACSKLRNLSAEPAKASDGSIVFASRACSEAREINSLWARISA